MRVNLHILHLLSELLTKRWLMRFVSCIILVHQLQGEFCIYHYGTSILDDSIINDTASLQALGSDSNLSITDIYLQNLPLMAHSPISLACSNFVIPMRAF